MGPSNIERQIRELCLRHLAVKCYGTQGTVELHALVYIRPLSLTLNITYQKPFRLPRTTYLFYLLERYFSNSSVIREHLWYFAMHDSVSICTH